MNKRKLFGDNRVLMVRRILQYVAVCCFAVSALTACQMASSSLAAKHQPVSSATEPATSLFASDEGTEVAIRSLEERVKRNSEDFIAENKLAGYYLQRLRETGDLSYLNLISRAAQASLAALPAEQNLGGLHALTQSEFAAHEFIAARDHAKQLIKLASNKSYPYELLGDALVELGEYEQAALAYREMERLGGTTSNGETRWARLAYLHGEIDAASKRFQNALTIARETGLPQRETIAWCQWQLGETAFSKGDYESAENHYRASLETFPDYYRALAGLGRARAARQDVNGAIEYYVRAVRRLPDPLFVAALGDLYKLAGREKDAAAQYALITQLAKMDASRGSLYNRQLAIYYADHDLNAKEAYVQATKEFSLRHDIYGADALAWTALKAGQIGDAQKAIKDALRLGTRDARIFYHAGMIARAAGNTAEARDYLQRALTLNPQFDPMQSNIAHQALTTLQK